MSLSASDIVVTTTENKLLCKLCDLAGEKRKDVWYIVLRLNFETKYQVSVQIYAHKYNLYERLKSRVLYIHDTHVIIV